MRANSQNMQCAREARGCDQFFPLTEAANF